MDAELFILSRHCAACQQVHLAYAAITDSRTVFEVDTDSPACFNNAKALLRVRGWAVEDVSLVVVVAGGC